MNGALLTYVGAFLTLGWGVAHLFPTRSVVAAFGPISIDNNRIITMEWITEGVALIFIGILAAMATFLDRSGAVTRAIYWLTFCALNTLSLVSLFTGFKISFIPYKLCPFLFTGSSILIIAGSYLN